MFKTKKGQTAFEYLIILAVVIVVALIVVGVMGGIPWIGSKHDLTRSGYCKSLNLTFSRHESEKGFNDDKDFYCIDYAINNKRNDDSEIFVTDNEYLQWKNRTS